MTRVSPAFAFAAASIGIAVYSVMDAIMKVLAIASGAYSAVLWRSVAGVAIMGSVFVAQRRRWPGRVAFTLHVQRGLAAGLSVLFFFWGLARVPMAKGVALTFLAPLIALFLAAAVLGERLRPRAILGSAVAGGGVLVIAAGEVEAKASEDSVLGALAILVASVLYGISLVLQRRQAQLAEPIEVALFTSVVIGTLLLVGAPWLSGWPASAQLPAIFGAAALGSVSAVLLAFAYRHAEAQVVAPAEYTAFVWAALLGWLVFAERVSAFTLTGAALIIAGCILAVRKAGPTPLSEANA